MSHERGMPLTRPLPPSLSPLGAREGCWGLVFQDPGNRVAQERFFCWLPTMAEQVNKRLAFILLLLMPAGLLAQDKRLEETEEAPYTISLNVDLIILDVSVVDPDGKFVSGLEAQNFKIYEDGRQEQIAYFLTKDVPVTVGLAIDNSGSMRGKRAEIVAAAMAFVEASNPHDEMFVVHFNENVRFGLGPAKPFTNDPLQLRTAFLRMIADGQTALYDAVSQAIEHLAKGKHDRKALLIVSDGGDNASHRELKETLQLVQSSRAVLYTISLYDPSNRDQKPRVLRRLAKASGGESFFPKELEQIRPVCRRIATDIRNQYLPAYRSSNSKRDGAFRQVRVTLDTPARKNLVVRTREGYFAPSDGAASRAPAIKANVAGVP